ncbi:hypothetical protein PL373_13635 [Tenacibaculum maritimum]|nr:hypothetical protein [Tenacibaculum maritimum]MDB0602171.1 hypothetical protein [Tenacibaculum maritimum]MDB0613847.1 hypothetical protein [Tenacibaculum maritimum]
MAEAIVKYSQLIDDDGGFEKLKSDLKETGRFIKKEAESLKGQISLLNPKDIDALNNFAEAVDVLKSSYKSVESTLKVVHNVQKDYKKTNEQLIKLNNLQGKSLTDLELKLTEYRLELKKTNAFEKQGIINTKEAAKKRAELKVQIKDVTQAINKEQKEVIQSNKLSKDEIKLQEALIKIQNERVETLKEVRERISALRIAVQNSNITTEEGRQKIADYNKEIDELTEVLKQNSDKFIQNKINVGGYTESIVEALKETDLFKTNIVFLDTAIEKIVSRISKLTKSTDKNTEANKKNTKSISGLRKGFRALGTALKATGIILLLTLLASLFSIFKQGRSGVIKTQKAMAVFNATVKVLIGTLADLGKGFLKFFSALFSSFSNFGKRIKSFGLEIKKVFLEIANINPIGKSLKPEIEAVENQIRELNNEIEKNGIENGEKYAESWNLISDAIGGFSQRYKDAKDSVNTSFEGIVRAFEIGDQIRKVTLELIDLRAELRELELTSDDSTLSLRTQLEATRLALTKNLEVLEKENQILKLNLSVTNAKAKADLQANATTIGARANAIAGIKDEIKFAKALLQLNIDLSEREGKNPLDDNLLEEQQKALQALIEGEKERGLVILENAKKRREIERDIFEQNLDLLIDLIDKEKDLSEQLVNDVTINFESRLREFQRFLSKFRINAQKELDEFNKFAKSSELDIEFSVDFKDDGDFDVFLGDQKLAIDNIVELNEQLQNSELNEITINRFREWVQEIQTAKRDFKEINNSLTSVALRINELQGERIISQEELDEIRKLNAELKGLEDIDFDSLSRKQQDDVIKRIKDIEDRKSKIQDQAEEKRLRNRLKSIDAELKAVEEGSEIQLELLNERLGIEKELEDKQFQRLQKSLSEAAAKSKDKWEKLVEDLNTILTEVFSRIEETQRRTLQNSERNLDKQQDAVDDQRLRAQNGLTNTLAFEQKELAKREARVLQQQKRLDRIQKLQSYWRTYNANLSSLKDGQDSNDAIVKTLKSIAVIEGITASLQSFGDGGIVEDKLPSNGVFRGQSHQGNKGGIPIMVEGREGIFSVNEMNNMGRDNFYALKELANRGKLNTNFFAQQRSDFTKTVPIFPSNKNLEYELKEVKRAIVNKPVTDFDVVKLANAVELISTTSTPNKTVYNRFKIKKRKL